MLTAFMVADILERGSGREKRTKRCLCPPRPCPSSYGHGQGKPGKQKKVGEQTAVPNTALDIWRCASITSVSSCRFQARTDGASRKIQVTARVGAVPRMGAAWRVAAVLLTLSQCLAQAEIEREAQNGRVLAVLDEPSLRETHSRFFAMFVGALKHGLCRQESLRLYFACLDRKKQPVKPPGDNQVPFTPCRLRAHRRVRPGD